MTEAEKRESLPKQIKALLSDGAEMTASQINEKLGGTYKASEISRTLCHLRNSGVLARRHIEREGALGPKKVWVNRLVDTNSETMGEAA